VNIFDRARALVAQSPHPTTLREQLGRLARRKRTRVNIAKERAKAPAVYWWSEP
jgi:hypothetical protein